jgi:hypothetical protein
MTLNEYVNQIVIELKVRMEESPLFPFDDGTREVGQKPRPQFKPHARNVALKNNPILRLLVLMFKCLNLATKQPRELHHNTIS